MDQKEEEEKFVKNVFNTIPSFKAETEDEKPGQLSKQQIEQFFDKGWIVIPNLIEVYFIIF